MSRQRKHNINIHRGLLTTSILLVPADSARSVDPAADGEADAKEATGDLTFAAEVEVVNEPEATDDEDVATDKSGTLLDDPLGKTKAAVL